MNIFNSFRRVFGRNRALARSGHMVRNKLCWDANNAVGLSKQRKIELDGLLFGFLYFGSPTALFASQHNFCGYHRTWSCKGPICRKSTGMLQDTSFENGFRAYPCLFIDWPFLLWWHSQTTKLFVLHADASSRIVSRTGWQVESFRFCL